MTCALISPSLMFFLRSLIHITVLYTFLVTFFVLVIAPTSHDTITNELDEKIKDTLTNTLNEDPQLQTVVKTLQDSKILTGFSDMYKGPSAAVKEHNSKIYERAFGILGLLVVGIVVLIIGLKMGCGGCIPKWQIIVENILIFSMVGAVEAWFFLTIAMHFIPVVPSYMAERFVTDLKNAFS